MKIVVNRCYGGFGLSQEALDFLDTNSGHQYGWPHMRHSIELVECVEELGNKAGGEYSELKVIDIPDGIEWEIWDHGGMESIHEKHRKWPSD